MSLIERLEQARTGIASTDVGSSGGFSSAEASAVTPTANRYAMLKKSVQAEVIRQVNSQDLSLDVETEEGMRELIARILIAEAAEVPRADRSAIADDVYSEVAGLGPLDRLMDDPSISEIMVNGPKRVYIERKGKLILSNVTFEDDAHVVRILDRIVSKVGRRVDEANPMVDARLLDGSRVNAIIPPIALNGPSITIRRFSSAPLQIANLIEGGSINYAMASFLEACVRGKANMVVSGGTGSGKTTLLNILLGFVSGDERIVTIEDAAEVQLEQDHVVSLESRPANAEGKGAVVIRDLVKNALRMRPDRIIVGEVRSAETLDMLQAMNTGHEGSLTMVHANSPRDVISRMETMILMGGIELPVRAIRAQISSALDIIVQQARFRDGSRKIVSVSEVLGMEGDNITLQDIFVFQPDGLDAGGRIKGSFVATGIRPKILKKFEESGIMIRDEWFV